MNWTVEEINLLKSHGWQQSEYSCNAFLKQNQMVSKSGNIINWSGKCKIYAPSPEDFSKWLQNSPKFFNPSIKQKL